MKWTCASAKTKLLCDIFSILEWMDPATSAMPIQMGAGAEGSGTPPFVMVAGV